MDLQDHSGDNFHNDLICPACKETLTSPKLLSCMHSFCEQCVEPMLEDEKKQIECPVCKHTTKVNNGIKSLSTNFIAQNVIEALEAMTLKSEGVLKCSECEQDVAINFCCDCYQKLCLVCTAHHKRSLKLKDHNIMEFEDVSRDQMSQGRIKQCLEHNEVVKFYCNDCSYTICHDCSVSKKHSGHTYSLLDEIVAGNKQQLKGLVKSAERKMKAMNRSINEAENTLQNIHEVKEASVRVVEQTFQGIQEVLKRKEDEAIKSINEKFEVGVMSINLAKRNNNILEKWISFTNIVIQNRCNAEIMDIFLNLRNQLAEMSMMSAMKSKVNNDSESGVEGNAVAQFANPNSKSRRRVSSMTQSLALKKHDDGPLIKEVDASTGATSNKSTHTITRSNTDATSLTSGIAKMFPQEMTPDIPVEQQVLNQEFIFVPQVEKSNISNQTIRHKTQNSIKKPPPPRPPPAKVHLEQQPQKRKSVSFAEPLSPALSQPKYPPPPPPSVATPPTHIRSDSIPVQLPPPPRLMTSANKSSPDCSSEIEFPIPPIAQKQSDSDIKTKERQKSLVELASTYPKAIETEVQDIQTEQFHSPEAIPSLLSTTSATLQLSPTSSDSPILPTSPTFSDSPTSQSSQTSPCEQPIAPPRFCAGITIIKQDIDVNKDVVKLIIETVTDTCSIASKEAEIDVTYEDVMFTLKEEHFTH